MFIIVHASLVIQTVKNLPAVQETPVQPLDQEDPLEKGMATDSNMFAWKMPSKRSMAGYSPWTCRIGHDSCGLSPQETQEKIFPDFLVGLSKKKKKSAALGGNFEGFNSLTSN